MATIIDAFVTEMTLDGSGYARGQAEVRAQDKKTRDQIGQSSKTLDDYGKRATAFFSKLRSEAVGLFLAFQGASSIKGYISDILTGDAATGRLAKNIGVATQELSAWQMAIKSVGGTAEDANSALSSIAEAFQNYLLTGQTGHDADFKGLGVTLKDLEDPTTALLKMAEAAERMDQTEFYARMRRIGIPDAVITQLAKGRQATADLIEEKKRDGAATDEDAAAAQRFEQKLAQLESRLKGLARDGLYPIIEALLDFLDGVEGNNAVVPILTGLVVALGVAAVGAAGPFIGLAAAVAGVTYSIDELIRTSPRLRSFLDGIEKPIKDMLGPKWEWLFRRPGNLEGNSGSENESPYAGGGGAGAAAGDLRKTGNYSSVGNREAFIRGYLQRSGFSPEQVRGIMAGMYAENTTFDPNIRGGYKGRAVGIGQWLGARRKKLLDRYGPNPTLAQQMAFLVEELKGGDPGGASVRASGSAEETLSNYIGGDGWGFMRPGAGRAGDMRRGYQYLGRGPVRTATGAARPSAGGGTTYNTNVGTIVVHTAATDADGIARELPGAIRRRGLTTQANRGMQ